MSKGKGISKEIKIAFVVIFCALLAWFGIEYLGGTNLFKSKNEFYAVYDNIDYLKESNPVFFSGRKVGMVTETSLDVEHPGKIVVRFSIDEASLNIPDNSLVTIMSSDILGSKGIELTLGDSPNMATAGSELQSSIELDMAEALRKELEPLKKKTDELIGGIDAIVTNLKAVFDDDATKDLPKAFESLQRSLENLEGITMNVDNVVNENGAKISTFLDNINGIAENLNNNNDELTKIITNFSSLSDSLAQTNIKRTVLRADSAMGELENVITKINSGQGSIGLLLNNDSLHNALVQSNVEVQTLINDIYENPWRYVHISIFGKNQKRNYSKKELRELREIIDEAIEESDGSK